MQITVNGEKQVLGRPDITVADLIQLNQVKNPDMVSVQHNGEFLDRAQYGSVVVKDGDEVDFLYFMGGGNLHGGF